MALKKFEEISPEMQSLITEEYESGNIEESLYQRMKTNGVSAEDWANVDVLAQYFGGKAPKEFLTPEEQKSIDETKRPYDDSADWYIKLKKGLYKLDEKSLRVEVRKRDPMTNRLQYMKGGTIPWNIDAGSFTDLLDFIGKRFGGGEYHLTFRPEKNDSKLQPFTKQETIITDFGDERKIEQPTMQNVKDDTKEVLNQTLTSVGGLVSQFQNQLNLQQNDFKLMIANIMDKSTEQIKELVKNLGNISNRNTNSDINPQKTFSDMFNMVTALVEKITPKPVNIDEIVGKRLDEFQKAMQIGMDLGSRGEEEEYEEDEGEGEGEETEEKKDKRPIGKVIEDSLKDLGGGTIKELIKSVVDSIKGTPKQSPEAIEEKVEPDTKNIMIVLNQLENLLKSYKDETIADWFKENAAPAVIKQLKDAAPEQIKEALKNLKPELLTYIDRIVNILKII